MAKRDKSLADVEAELALIKKNLEAKRAKLAAMEKERNAVLGRLVWLEIERDPKAAFADKIQELIASLTLKKERALFDLPPAAEKTSSNDNQADTDSPTDESDEGDKTQKARATKAFMGIERAGGS